MKYMLLMYWKQADVPPQSPEAYKESAKEWSALSQEMEAAGVLLSSNGLAPATQATTVRVRDSKTLIADGPFAETHEQLGGFYLLECKDLDEALKWAAKIPAAQTGSIEVRPLWNNM